MEDEDGDWEEDEILCDDCYEEQTEEEETIAKGVITRLVKYVKKYLKNKQRVMEEQRERMKKCVKVMNGRYFKEWVETKKLKKQNFKNWMRCLTKISKHKGTIQTQEFLIDALRDEITELKEQIKKQKVEMKWKIWGTTMLEHDYDIVNDYDAWDCVVMEHGFSKEEIEELSKYYPCPENPHEDYCKCEGKFDACCDNEENYKDMFDSGDDEEE